MKKMTAGIIAAGCIAVAVGANAEELRYRPDPGTTFCIARGFSNLATCWLEIPRCIIYDNSEQPFIGWFVGLGEGVGFTVARAFTGVYDLVSFGSSGDSLHSNNFPDFVFEAPWTPPKAEAKAD